MQDDQRSAADYITPSFFEKMVGKEMRGQRKVLAKAAADDACSGGGDTRHEPRATQLFILVKGFQFFGIHRVEGCGLMVTQ